GSGVVDGVRGLLRLHPAAVARVAVVLRGPPLRRHPAVRLVPVAEAVAVGVLLTVVQPAVAVDVEPRLAGRRRDREGHLLAVAVARQRELVVAELVPE